jgi:hypothetical protein
MKWRFVSFSVRLESLLILLRRQVLLAGLGGSDWRCKVRLQRSRRWTKGMAVGSDCIYAGLAPYCCLEVGKTSGYQASAVKSATVSVQFGNEQAETQRRCGRAWPRLGGLAALG